MTTINYKLITAWDEKDVIHAIVKEDGIKKKIVVKDFKWHFFIKKEELTKSKMSIINKYKDAGIIIKGEKDGDAIKVYCDKSKSQYTNGRNLTIKTLHSELLNAGITPLEIDLPLYKRWLYDNDIQIETDLKILFFDIETDDTIGNIEIGRDRILSVGFYDNKGQHYFISNPDEKILIEETLSLISQHDVICGWNSAKFDLPYIKSRADQLGVKHNWQEIVHVDMMLRLIKLFASISGLLGLNGFSLNEVSRVFLKDSKVKFDGKIIDLYHNDFEKFKEYNIKDVSLLYELDIKISCLALMIKECEWTGTFLNNFYIGEILDNYILKEAKKKGVLLHSKPTYNELLANKALEVRGGYVMTPAPGRYDNVRVFDFKSMYPSIMITWNIGEDSLNYELSKKGQSAFAKFLGERKVEDVDINEFTSFLEKQKKKLDPEDKHFQAANNVFFSKEHKSLIPGLVQELLDQRKVYKKKLDSLEIDTDDYRTARATQEVVKEMANSIFGITADRNSRYFNIMVCEAITITGQFLNRSCMRIAKEHDIESIYGDTDSFFLSINDDEHTEHFTSILNDELKLFMKTFFGIDETIVHVEYEKKFGKLVIVKKKKYTGRLTWMDDKPVDTIFSRGVEIVKKDTIGYVKKHIRTLIDMLVKDDATVQQCKDWLYERKREIEENELDASDLSITVRVARSPSTYKTPLLHVRIAKDLIDRGLLQDIVEGKTNAARISYIVTGTEGGMQGVELADFKGEWDRVHYWNVKIFAVFQRLLDATFPDEDWSTFKIKKDKKFNVNQDSLF